MSQVPDDLLYTTDHEWVRREGEFCVIGITAYAQDSLGDITYVELPATESALTAGDPFGVVESVKAASDLYAPLSGQVVEINSLLETNPEKVNQDPYGEGWMIRIKPESMTEDSLLNAGAYRQHIGS